MKPRMKSYCVAVLEYDCYEIWVDAPNRPEACKMAQANWDEYGADGWKHTNNGVDKFEVIDQRPVLKTFAVPHEEAEVVS